MRQWIRFTLPLGLAAIFFLSVLARGQPGALRPVSVQMHVHASMSEGNGSRRAANVHAKKIGLDVLWWTTVKAPIVGGSAFTIVVRTPLTSPAQSEWRREESATTRMLQHDGIMIRHALPGPVLLDASILEREWILGAMIRGGV